MVGYLALPTYKVEGLDPDSTWYASLCCLPMEGLVPYEDYMGSRKGGRQGKLGLACKMKNNF